MENQVTCPQCRRTITNHPVIDAAAKGQGPYTTAQFVICVCGERISFWAITAQLREQKRPVETIHKWFRGRTKDR